MRLVRGSDDLHWVRWYPAADDAEWYHEGTPFRSSQDRDAEQPDPSLGEVRSKCVQWVSCCWCPPPPKVCEVGNEDTFANGVRPEELAVAVPSSKPCGCACGRKAELVDFDPIQPQYGWWQHVCDPVTGIWSRGPAMTHRHRLQDDPAWDLCGAVGLPVPGTMVQVYEGCGPDRPWYFLSSDTEALVWVSEDSPTIELASGSAYHGKLAIQTLTGTVGEQEVSGAFAEGPAVAVVDLARCPTFDRTTPYHARRIGQADDLVVYATRLSPRCCSGSGSGSGSGSDPNVCAPDQPCVRVEPAGFPTLFYPLAFPSPNTQWGLCSLDDFCFFCLLGHMVAEVLQVPGSSSESMHFVSHNAAAGTWTFQVKTPTLNPTYPAGTIVVFTLLPGGCP